jgi:opacity protein-like surface antigen
MATTNSVSHAARRPATHRALALGLVLLLTVVSLGSTAGAQTSFKLGVSGGGTVPVGRFGDLNKPGFNFGAYALISSPFFPQDFKLEAQHNRMKLKGSSANTLVTSATLNLEWNLGSAVAAVSPYLTVGAGGYYVKTDLRATPTTTRYDNTTKFGCNAGAGLRMAVDGFNTFVEARFNRVSSKSFVSGKVLYVPIVFGLTL